MWLHAAAAYPEVKVVAVAVIVLEWATLVSTQTQAYLEGNRYSVYVPEFVAPCVSDARREKKKMGTLNSINPHLGVPVDCTTESLVVRITGIGRARHKLNSHGL
jgi:hypothetical protein